MAIFGALNGILTMVTSGWRKGADDAINDVDRIDKKTKGFFKELNASFGKRSILGQAFKLAAGGGAIAGLTAGLGAADKLVNKINELKTAYHNGEISAKDMAGEIAREIPILGGMVKIFDDIRESITGEKAAIEAQDKATKEWMASMDEAKKKHDAYIAAGKEAKTRFNEEAIEMQQHAILDAMPNGAAMAVKQQQFETLNMIRKLNDRFAKEINQEEIDRLQKRIGELNAKFAAGNGTDEDHHEFANLKSELQPLLANKLLLQKEHEMLRLGIIRDGAAKEKDIKDKAAAEDAQRLKEQREKLEEAMLHNRERLAELAKHVFEETRTPLEHLKEEVHELDILLATHAINADTYSRAKKKDIQNYLSSMDGKSGDEFKGVQAKESPFRMHVGREFNVGAAQKQLEVANATLEELKRHHRITEKEAKDIAGGRVPINMTP